MSEPQRELREALLHFPYSTEFQAVHSTLHQCLLPFATQLHSAGSCSQKLYILPDGSSGRSVFFQLFKAPELKINLYCCWQSSPKANVALNYPSWMMHHPSSQPWHWEGSSGFGCTMKDAIKVLICRKHGDFILPQVSAPSWAPKMVWNFPPGKYHPMPCSGAAVFLSGPCTGWLCLGGFHIFEEFFFLCRVLQSTLLSHSVPSPTACHWILGLGCALHILQSLP